MAAPVYVANSARTSADGFKVYLTYGQDLDNSALVDSAYFTVSVEDIGGTIHDVSPSAVSVSGDTVELSLETAIQSGDTVSVSYSDPDEIVDHEDVIQSIDGTDAASLTDIQVAIGFHLSCNRPLRALTAARWS